MDTLKYILRFLVRARFYTLINLLGLAFSLACSIILLRYIHRELTVDAHCIRPETVVVPLMESDGNLFPSSTLDMDSVYIGDGQIVERCRMVPEGGVHVRHEGHSYKVDLLAVDSTFFRFFTYPVAQGTVDMEGNDAAVLTRDCAERLFGRQNPVGQVLEYDGKTMTVRGVIDPPSCKATWHFDLLVSRGLMKNWNRMNVEMLRVLPGVDLDAVNRISSVCRETLFSEWIGCRFVRWEQLYFDKSILYEESLMNHGDRSYLLILSGVVALLLAVGILNFVNLYMVMLMKRSHEYGIKKVLGMGRRRLFAEIWLENVLLAGASLFAAWLLVEVTSVPVERLLGEPASYTPFDCWLSLGILAVLPLLTSVYPYVKYGYRPPLTSIRDLSVRCSVAPRVVLLTVQYVFTVLLVVLSLYFIRHFDFLVNTPPGFRTEGILEADLQMENWNYAEETPEASKARWKRVESIGKALDECPYVESWIHCSYDDINKDYRLRILNDKDVLIPMQALYLPARAFGFYGMTAVDGQLPDATDDYRHYDILLNEAAMKAFGYTDREEAFVRGESPLWIHLDSKGEIVKGGIEQMPVAAVVKDCYFGKLTEGVQPAVFVVGTESVNSKISIAVQPGKERELLAYLRKTVKEIYNAEDFDYAWLSDRVAEQYAHDRKIATVYSVFAFIAIVVSCMGLFGISLFDIRRRYREIAIRKVNGASLRDLCWLLGGRYLKVLLVSFVVAVPLAWLAIRHYTESFVLKAPLSPWIFVAALLLVAVISLGTVWWQVNRAARINPVDVMKAE